jgi:choline dehydrogenase-like flavoprotein
MAKASKYLNGRQALVGNGGILGGGSSVNYMMYSRAQAIDFDNWNTPGWAAKDMYPILNNMETYHINKDDPKADKTKHGYSGPIQISDSGFRSNNIDEFMKSITRAGFKEVGDLQDGEHIGGFSVRCSDF